MRSIAIASGKGGVGKTSITVNTGIALAGSGYKTTVVDADFGMANVSLLLGIDRTPLTLHNVLMGEASIKDAIYEGPQGMRFVPSGLSADKLNRMDFFDLKKNVKTLDDNDFVLIDCPPGLAEDAQAALEAAQELLLVLTPDPAALADALKVKNYADKKGLNIIGVVVNRVTGDKTEIKKKDLETILGVKVLVELPEDIEVRRSFSAQIPVILKMPSAPFCRGIRQLAGALTGGKIREIVTVKKSFLQSILDFIFRRK